MDRGLTLVGRFLQTEALQRLLDRAGAGAGGVLVVAGPSGSGRTAMADLAARLGSERDVEVLRGTQLSGRPAMSVWTRFLRDLGAPELADRLLGDVRAIDLDAAAAALCSARPRLIVIDDLDRGGPEAVDMLAVLAGRAASGPLAIMVTSTEPLGLGVDVWLGPLSPAEIAAVSGASGPDVVEAVWTTSRGRPGPALALGTLLRTLDPEQDPVVGLALSVSSTEGFLELDVGLIRLLEMALLRTADDPSRALLLARLAHALLGDAAAAPKRRALVEEAVTLARAGGDPAVLSKVLDARLHALWDSAGVYDRLDSATEIMELARRSADLDGERRGLFWRFVALMELARVSEAEATLAAYAREADAVGDRQNAVVAVARYAMLAAMRGSFDEATRLAKRVEVEGRQTGLPDTDRLTDTLRGTIGGLRGDPSSDGGEAEIELLRSFDRRIPGHFYDATVAFVLVRRGRSAEARLELDRALPHLLAGAGPRWVGAAAELADVAARTQSGEAAAALIDALLDYRGRLAMFAGANSTLGPVDHWLGILAASLGRFDEAVEWLEDAAALAERIAAWPFLAFSLSALADSLSARGRVDDHRRAAEYRTRASELARQLGLAELIASLTPKADEWTLRRDGQDWVLRAGREHARLPDGRGLHYLRALLAAPRQDIRCTDLAAGGAGLVVADREPVLDDQARAAYRRRLTAVQAALDDADARGDVEGAERAEAERSALLSELSRAAGLGSRSRVISAEDERARVNVTRTLRATLSRITEQAPLAAAYLDAAISTGRSCRYQPGPGGPTGWLL